MIINLGRFQVKVYTTIRQKREGVCSGIYDANDKHITLWDFDDVKLDDIIQSLTGVQFMFNLPNIYIVSSSENKYHAYSFTARSLREIICILSATPEIDIQYLRLGMVRGYYTLRISSRNNETFKLVKILMSDISCEVNPMDATVNYYLTTNKGGNDNAKG